jgi:enoyl-CoA hydratase/carnithine racemase
MMPNKEEQIKLSINDSVASIVLNRPPVNAFDDKLIEELGGALDQVEQHSDLSVLHIRSGLKVFCAGADLQMMEDCLETDDGRDQMIDIVRELQRVIDRIENLGAVTIAEIAGAALGGGLEFALACDLRVASDRAKLGQPEVSLGLIPGAGGTQRLPRICGEATARRLILGAEIIDGTEARRLGLVQWVIAADELRTWTDGLAKRLGSLPAEALASCKRCIAASRDSSVDGYELELTETRRLHDILDTQSRVRLFLENSGKRRARG